MKTPNIALALSILCQMSIAALEPHSFLEEADRYRQFDQRGFSATYHMTGSDGSKSSMRIAVRFLPSEAVLVHYIEPAREAGRRILVLENSYWLQEQGTRQPLRISARQILGGQAAAGDLSRVSFSRMYSLESVREEDEGYILFLNSKKNTGANYDKIELSTDLNRRPIQALCMGRSGVVLKQILYTGYTVFEGKEVLTRYRIVDPIDNSHIDIEISEYSSDIPAERAFSIHALRARQ